jgi:hypothetical protein
MDNKYCEGIDCAWCLNPNCPIINKERNKQTLKDLEDENKPNKRWRN